MIEVFAGDNDYELKATLRHKKNAFVAEHGLDSVESRSGDALSVADLPQLFGGTSLFSPQRLVIVYQISDNKTIWEKLPDVLSADEQTEVVLVEPRADKRTRTYKWLQKEAQIRQFGQLSDSELLQWLQTAAHQQRINLAPDIARYLVGYVGTDQWRLAQEITKLSLSNRPITQQLIQDIVDPNPEASAFALLDSAIAGKTIDMYRLLDIISIDEDPYRFVGLLTSQVYALSLASSAGDRPSATIAKDGSIHPFVASKAQASAKRLSKTKLRAMVDAIAELDARLKSTGGDPWLSVRICLQKIAA